MPCEWQKVPITTENGTEYVAAMMCSRGRRPARRCVVCFTTKDIKLCDFPLRGEKTGQTCDRPVCRWHAHHIEPDCDLCPAHARLLQDTQQALRVEGAASHE